MRSVFPAKVLLFGEHRVLRGAPALAVPFGALAVQWTRLARRPDQRLVGFAQYLERTFTNDELQTQVFKRDVLRGWQLVGNIPHGYGLGSSGAVCAAIWYRYVGWQGRRLSGGALRAALARMEHFFHGNSSGTDPLISLKNRPVLLDKEGFTFPELTNDLRGNFFLLDTGQERQSDVLVQQFLARYDADSAWREAVDLRWGVEDEQAIQAMLAGDEVALRQAFFALSLYQGALMRTFIPYPVQKVWRGSSHRLKLCGAGGGGFMLGYSTDWQQTQQELADFRLILL